MARIQRQRVAKHILVVDTNILWHGDKAFCVSPKFQKFLEVYAAKYEIDLVIPAVVMGELLYQQTKEALRALNKVNSEFTKMSAVASSLYNHRVSEKKVKSDVVKKLSVWRKNNNCIEHPTPVAEIDWNQIITKAIWREPPFTDSDKNKKGFRDAVIIETTISISLTYPEVDIVFISSDKLVVEAAKKNFDARLSCFETLEEFETYLKLSDEELTNNFVRSIQSRAKIKFHSKDSKDCLLYQNELISKIREDYPDKFITPSFGIINQARIGGLLRSSVNQNRWEPITNEQTWIRAPEFIRLENNNVYIWRSKIIYIQLFQHISGSIETILTGIIGPKEEKLRKIEFPVVWKSKVATNGRFFSLEIVEIEASETIFDEITDFEQEHYGIISQDETGGNS